MDGGFFGEELVPPLESRLDVVHDFGDMGFGPVFGAHCAGAFEEHGCDSDSSEHEFAGILRGGTEGEACHDSSVFEGFENRFTIPGRATNASVC